MLPRAYSYTLCGPGHSNSVPFPRTLITKSEQTVRSNKEKGTYFYFGLGFDLMVGGGGATLNFFLYYCLLVFSLYVSVIQEWIRELLFIIFTNQKLRGPTTLQLFYHTQTNANLTTQIQLSLFSYVHIHLLLFVKIIFVVNQYFYFLMVVLHFFHDVESSTLAMFHGHK